MERRIIHFFLPIYYDSASFLLLREQILRILPPHYCAELHLLDDSAGKDPAAQKIISPDITITRMPSNLGHQQALVSGLRRFLSTSDDNSLLVTMDGDGEDRAEDLPRLLKEYELHENCAPFVLAKRTKTEKKLTFQILHLVYKSIFRALTGSTMNTGNFAVTSSRSMKRIIFHPYFDLCYSSTLLRLGSPLRLVPCARGERMEGRSKMTFFGLGRHGVLMLLPFTSRIAARGALGCAVLIGLSLLLPTQDALTKITSAGAALVFLTAISILTLAARRSLPITGASKQTKQSH